MLEHGFYVTGTDTGIGKTVASTALLHALRHGGASAVGMKPVASGCVATAQGWRNDDALALLAASDPQPAYADLNPYALPLPLAPELAARAAGVIVELAPIQAAYARLRAQAQYVVVEGVGGWAAPLSGALDQVDVVRALDLPVVLVVGLRLGCLNHAYLTARAIAGDGCRLAGWIGNEIDPDAACRDEILELLRARIAAPCWGWLPHVRPPDVPALSRRLLLPFQVPGTTSGTDER
ncbi:dethiobiotin synthase [Cognatiluteimonas profundi]|uniref:dethiobiotin synthase n=1 Tax=Cognatiluteimonas profundi TaxID=2594501 RepID=UPI00131D9909|nr:dethiobiotin synthase [Lysobacter profundi]